MFKRSFALILALSLLISLFATTAFAGEMQNSLVDMLPEPGEKLTRAEFTAMLVKAAELPAPTKPVNLPLDVPTNAWYAGEIKTALGSGIISGSSKDALNPNQPVTQAQAVSMTARVLGLPSVPATGYFVNPVPSDHWAYVPSTWLLKDGILDASYAPDGFLTPAAGAALLDKVFGTAKEAKEVNDKSYAAQINTKTMRCAGDMNISMQANTAAPLGGMPATVNVQANVSQDFNQDQGIYQKFTMTMLGLPEAMPPMEMEQYMLADGMYMKMKNPMTNEVQWVKMPAGSVPNFAELMKQQSKTMQLPKELEKLFHYRLIGEKKVGQDTFYELDFYGNIPNLSQFMNIFGSQAALTPELKKSFEQSSSLITGISMAGKCLINKDNYLADKVNATVVVTFADTFQGQPFPLKNMSANFNFQYKDYNSDINIKLPAEAAKAEVLTLGKPEAGTTTPVQIN